MKLTEITLPNGKLTGEQAVQWVQDSNHWKDVAEINTQGEVDVLSKTHSLPRSFGAFSLNDKFKPLSTMPVNFGIVLNFNVRGAQLTSFDGFPHTVHGYVDISKTKITSFVGISDVFKYLDTLYLNECAIRKGGIGLLLIPGLTQMLFQGVTDSRTRAFNIIHKYLGKPEDIYECQTELIEAGLEEFAEL